MIHLNVKGKIQKEVRQTKQESDFVYQKPFTKEDYAELRSLPNVG